MIVEQIHRPEGKRCPFAKASIEVTELLCSHWNINSGCMLFLFDIFGVLGVGTLSY